MNGKIGEDARDGYEQFVTVALLSLLNSIPWYDGEAVGFQMQGFLPRRYRTCSALSLVVS